LAEGLEIPPSATPPSTINSTASKSSLVASAIAFNDTAGERLLEVLPAPLPGSSI
jgi:hypothetical protein